MKQQPIAGPIAPKGPLILAPDVIKDIVENRTIKDASRVLAAKHGISSERVRKIWYEYYGGTTLAHAKNGLVKKLPTVGVARDATSKRRVRGVTGTFAVREPKIATAAEKKKDIASRANPVRKLAREEPEVDLELTDTGLATMDDTEAEILAGEVDAGNNSDMLLAAINALVLTNRNLTDVTKRHLRAAYNRGVVARGKERRAKYSDNDNSCASASETETEAESDREESYDTDDASSYSDAEGGEGPRGGAVFGQTSVPYQVPRPGVREYRDSNMVGREGNGSLQRADVGGGQLGARPAGSEARARPVYRTVADDGAASGAVQADSLQAPGHEQALPAAKYSAGRQAEVYTHNARDGPQQHTGAAEGDGTHWPCRARPGSTLSRPSWLGERPI